MSSRSEQYFLSGDVLRPSKMWEFRNHRTNDGSSREPKLAADISTLLFLRFADCGYVVHRDVDGLSKRGESSRWPVMVEKGTWGGSIKNGVCGTGDSFTNVFCAWLAQDARHSAAAFRYGRFDGGTPLKGENVAKLTDGGD